MPPIEIIYVLTTFASVIATILAWVAKLRWSNEYSAAKDEIIRSKDAEIELLNTQRDEIIRSKDGQIEQLKAHIALQQGFSSVKIRENYISMKEQLEEYNDLLQTQLAEKEEELRELQLRGNPSMVKSLEAEKAELQDKLDVLRETIDVVRFSGLLQGVLDRPVTAAELATGLAMPEEKIVQMLEAAGYTLESTDCGGE